MKSKVISLCAVASSLVAILLTIGAYIEMTDVFMLVTASIIVLLPLYYNSFKGSLLTFLVGGVIAVILSAFSFAVIFPAYFTFFGIYPIVRHKMLQKNVKNLTCIVVGLIWCIIAFYLCYLYYTVVLQMPITDIPEQFAKYVVYLVGLLAVVFFFVFDRSVIVLKFTIDKTLRRIIK
ncbi:MAG: hypothetical protein E7348_02910 [Clostridiales bacterium]|nr:hypothetical protein [Clostridiales bacterium]